MQSKQTRVMAVLPVCSIAAIVFVVAGCASMAETSEGAYATSVQRALEYLPDAESLEWVDPETEVPSRVTVLDTTQAADGRYCRNLVFAANPEASENPDAAFEPVFAPDGADIGEPTTYCRDGETGSWEVEDDTTS